MMASPRRLLVLNLYLPLFLSLYNGVGRSLPTTDVNAVKTVIIYIACSLPVFFLAHLMSKGAYRLIADRKLPKQAALLIGGAGAVVGAYFYLAVFSYAVWAWVPWLEGGFSYQLTPSIGAFGAYLRSSTSLLLIPVWYCANLIYEYAAKDHFYFKAPAQGGANEHPRPTNSIDEAAGPVGVLAKLPSALGTDFIAMEAQQHYVNVHMAGGSELVLYRFGDAAAELEAQKLGVRVHRSYLVAPKHIERNIKRGRMMYVEMSNGLEVPVSQSYRALVLQLSDAASAAMRTQ